MNEFLTQAMEAWNSIPPQVRALVLFGIAGALDGLGSTVITTASQINQAQGFQAAFPEIGLAFAIFIPMLAVFTSAVFTTGEMNNFSVAANTLAFTLAAVGSSALLDGTIKHWDPLTWGLGTLAVASVMAFMSRVIHVVSK